MTRRNECACSEITGGASVNGLTGKMLMSVTTENSPVQGQTTLQENTAGEAWY